MQLVWSFLKVVIVLGIIGFVGYVIYKKANVPPATTADVNAIVVAIAQVVGDSKTELTATDKPSVEFQTEKLKGMDIDTILSGLVMFDPEATRAQYVAVELILLRIYERRPEGYVSRIDGDPWDVSGDLTQMGVFEIDRSSAGPELLSAMVDVFSNGVKARPEWAGT